MSDDAVTQMFYCNDCNGYIKVKLNMGLNYSVRVKCPECGREHPRTIENGMIVNDYSSNGGEVICPPKSCYSKESFTDKIKTNARDGVRMNETFWKERWLEKAERERWG